jgi:riboflavin kinase/FMN adenylyltransferase
VTPPDPSRLRTTFDAAKLTPADRGAVVSVGVFDGVHLGHQAILRANVARAVELGAEPTVVTFRRHPKQLLLGRAPRALTTLEHRLELFRRAGIQHAVALNFDGELRSQSAAEFAQRLLVEGLDARHLVLGFDSKFGKDREGTPDRLRELGFEVDVVGQVLVAKRPVSSTAIREAVELGDLVGAEAMLGRPVALLGRVVHGDARGRQLGFPTANLNPLHELHPPPGVYACRASRLERASDRGSAPRLEAVTHIGPRPTVDGEAGETRVEVHLLDFEGDLYGAHLEVEFVAQLRGPQRFPDLEALKAQIGRDVAAARDALRGSA